VRDFVDLFKDLLIGDGERFCGESVELGLFDDDILGDFGVVILIF